VMFYLLLLSPSFAIKKALSSSFSIGIPPILSYSN
jgi:hypothetical protein